MRRTFFSLFVFVVLALTATSCVTSKSVRYLRDMPKEGLPLNEDFEATIAPYDELQIYVSNNGGDEKLLKPFEMAAPGGYLVDVKGNIEFPSLGDLHVAGLTRLQLQDTICARLKSEGILNRPMVSVRLMNFKVFFLSSNGGKVLTVNNERCTFLEALAMSGGIDFHTRRDRIGVMRNVDGRWVIHYLDPRSTSVFEDEFFLLQQNDIIFTEETGFSFLRENLSSWMLVVSSITSLASVGLIYVTIKNLISTFGG